MRRISFSFNSTDSQIGNTKSLYVLPGFVHAQQVEFKIRKETDGSFR